MIDYKRLDMQRIPLMPLKPTEDTDFINIFSGFSGSQCNQWFQQPTSLRPFFSQGQFFRHFFPNWGLWRLKTAATSVDLNELLQLGHPLAGGFEVTFLKARSRVPE